MQVLVNSNETLTAAGAETVNGASFRPGFNVLSLHLVSSTDGGTITVRVQLLSGGTWVNYNSTTVDNSSTARADVTVIPGATYRVSATFTAAGSAVIAVVG